MSSFPIICCSSSSGFPPSKYDCIMHSTRTSHPVLHLPTSEIRELAWPAPPMFALQYHHCEQSMIEHIYITFKAIVKSQHKCASLADGSRFYQLVYASSSTTSSSP
ncbi:hypothetical protein FRB93_011267 [Tulasnella sp. JGI-2019a]|nr:hypothetical protein FRB93_011267 [Tulasnella sp. JGI-2019a]